jgi:hypothetical protein
LLVAIHVNRLASQVKDKERMMTDTYGLTSYEPLAFYDHDSQSWRMYAVISLWGLTESLEILPKTGLTRNGKLFPQPVLVPCIDAKESFVWPTPTTQEIEHPNAELNANGRRKAKNGNSHSIGLADAVIRWPTPTASSWGSTGHRMMLDSLIESGEITQEDKMQMTAGNGGKLNPTWVEWLMGFPTGWTDLEDSETQSCHRLQNISED